MQNVLLVEESEHNGEASNVIGIFPDNAEGEQAAYACAALANWGRVGIYRVPFGVNFKDSRNAAQEILSCLT